jgi:hypothetical protein
MKNLQSYRSVRMSYIGVDELTYNLMYKRTFAQCLGRCRGDPGEAKALAAYYMRDWYVIGDGRDERIISNIAQSSRRARVRYRPSAPNRG